MNKLKIIEVNFFKCRVKKKEKQKQTVGITSFRLVWSHLMTTKDNNQVLQLVSLLPIRHFSCKLTTLRLWLSDPVMVTTVETPVWTVYLGRSKKKEHNSIQSSEDSRQSCTAQRWTSRRTTKDNDEVPHQRKHRAKFTERVCWYLW